MRQLIHIYCLLLCCCTALPAQTSDSLSQEFSAEPTNVELAKDLDEASIAELYAKGKYQEAIREYEALLGEKRNQQNPALYYNLGNAYYQSGKLAEAVLAFERAHRLSPSDRDIKHNLKLSRLKVIDPIDTESSILNASLERLVNSVSANLANTLTIFFFVLTVLALLVFLLSKIPNYRRIGFYTGGIAAFFCLAFFALSSYQRHVFAKQTLCIVMEAQANMKEMPLENSSNMVILHAGSRVHLAGERENEYVAITLDDGRQGWIKKRAIEAVNPLIDLEKDS